MKDNRNQSLIGVILVLIGMYLLANRVFGIDILPFQGLMWLFVGGALLLLYNTKRKTWALVLGSLFILVGLLGNLSSTSLDPSIIASLVFIIPGIVFMVLYRQTRTPGFLIPGSILLWFGSFIFITIFPIPNVIQGGLFFLFIGMSFVMMYLLGKDMIGKWPLIPASILIGFGGVILLTSSLRVAIRFFPYIIPVILIGIGVWIIVQNRRKQ
ncbi:MAG: hypothetical protein GX238_07685 [Epulopiscium sp.]|nr:hypothetical protein [Candidatus Epulonipiscium sp.]